MHIPTLYGSKISCQKKSSNEIHARYMCSYAMEGRRGKNVMLLTLARNNMLLSSTRCAAFHVVLFCILLLFASLVHNTTIMILWWHSSRRMWPCAACHCRNLLLPISYWNGSFYFYHSTTIAKYLCQISGYMLGQQRDICRRRWAPGCVLAEEQPEPPRNDADTYERLPLSFEWCQMRLANNTRRK